MNFDVVIVGAGLAGCTMARLLSSGNTILIVEERDHIGGNCYDYYNEHGILTHKYGPHFFHTDDKEVFQFLSNFTDWHYYQHRVLSYINGTYLKFPSEAIPKCYSGYTQKQWGDWADRLHDSVTDRVKLLNPDDDRYFNDKYQAMPKHGYTNMLQNMIEGIPILLNTRWQDVCDHIGWKKCLIWTGSLDTFFSYQHGRLPYRSLHFEHETLDQEYYQQCAQINYPVDYDFTRIVEIKHATGQKHHKTTIVREYPCEPGIPYYPIPCEETEKMKDVLFIGRLAEYEYINMDTVIKKAFILYEDTWKNLYS